ncbi:hypothetical protein [Candidatus Pantoea deserta]|uniref:hypothetical protein n=1 Tax=Candidatus Pantoea deserta TaxID=1869313 RepID=UPI001F35A85A|nr:hypothetical protein [Pantoea deserta]
MRCGLDTGANPPTFHEIRSLSGRLYETRNGEAFAQRLLGHKNLSMTKSTSIPEGTNTCWFKPYRGFRTNFGQAKI